jgi:hypothetical protein
MTIFLVSCQTSSPEQQIADPSRVTLQENQKVQSLLAAADLALEENRLTTPLDDNAYLKYLQVLAIEPGNKPADQGIANIVEKYLAWSMDAVYSGQYRKATDYLNKAKSVDENHPNIESVTNLISSYLEGGRKTFVLSRTEIEEKNSETLKTLKLIAADITKFDARVVIEAPSDPAARWIYQQLNQATIERVSARFEMTSRVRIHLFY